MDDAQQIDVIDDDYVDVAEDYEIAFAPISLNKLQSTTLSAIINDADNKGPDTINNDSDVEADDNSKNQYDNNKNSGDDDDDDDEDDTGNNNEDDEPENVEEDLNATPDSVSEAVHD